MKRWLACLLAVLMAIVLVVPALGQEMGEENVPAEVDLSAEAEVESYEMMAEEETDEGEPLEADTVVEPAPLIPPAEEEEVTGNEVVMEAEDTSVEAEEVSLADALDDPVVAESDDVETGSLKIEVDITVKGNIDDYNYSYIRYNYTISGSNGYLKTISATVDLEFECESVFLKDIPVGEYTITEEAEDTITEEQNSKTVVVLAYKTTSVYFSHEVDLSLLPQKTPIPTPTPVPTPSPSPVYIPRAASLTLKKDAKKTVGPGDVLVVVPGSAAKSVKSSRTSVATAKLSGGLINVTTKAEGKAVITVTLKNGKALKLTLTVVDPTIPKSITLNKTKATVYLGKTLRLKHTLKPATSWDYVKWVSTNAKVAKVNASGVVTPVKAGKAYVVAMAQRGKISAVATITVKDPNQPNGVALAPDKKSIYLGETLDLSGWVTVTYPKPALVTSPATLTWKSSDKKVAKVSAAGLVTPAKTGSVTVTATSANGKTATCRVTVKDPNLPKGVAFTADKASVRLGGRLALADSLTCAYPRPALVTAAPTLTWKSSDATIAKVSKSGVVTPVKAGRATITATTANGKRAAIVVTVRK